MSIKRSDKILMGVDDICMFLGGINRDLFTKLLEMGMPVVQFNNRYYAHSENIENWFKANTALIGKDQNG